jgi:hypothetical protein
MTEISPRPVPHINHTQDLAQAANTLANTPLPIGLEKVTNGMDVYQVRESLQQLGQWFMDPKFFFPDDPDGELKAVEYAVVLVTLLREHLRAGNHS